MAGPESEGGRPADPGSAERAVTSLADAAGAHDTTDVRVRDVRGEIAVATGVVAFGAALIVLGSQLRQGAIPDPVTTGGLPVVTGIMLIVLGGVVGLRALRARSHGRTHLPSEGTDDEPGFPASWQRTIVFAVGCLVWAYLIPRLSYVLMTPIFLGLAIRGLGVVSWRKVVIVPIIFTALSWYLFGNVLTIRLPWGVFEPWARQMGLIL